MKRAIALVVLFLGCVAAPAVAGVTATTTRPMHFIGAPGSRAIAPQIGSAAGESGLADPSAKQYAPHLGTSASPSLVVPSTCETSIFFDDGLFYVRQEYTYLAIGACQYGPVLFLGIAPQPTIRLTGIPFPVFVPLHDY
jgi:hypothetical protein